MSVCVGLGALLRGEDAPTVNGRTSSWDGRQGCFQLLVVTLLVQGKKGDRISGFRYPPWSSASPSSASSLSWHQPPTPWLHLPLAKPQWSQSTYCVLGAGPGTVGGTWKGGPGLCARGVSHPAGRRPEWQTLRACEAEPRRATEKHSAEGMPREEHSFPLGEEQPGKASWRRRYSGWL